MKQLMIILILLVFMTNLHAQSNEITIGVIVPDQQGQIDNKAFRLLTTKLESIMLSNGISSGQSGDFVMYPVINILNQNIIEGGLKNITSVEVELSLFIIQLSSHSSYASNNTILKGQGKSLSNAICNAFSSIKTSNKTYSDFISEGKNKIIDYYVSNQENIINNARTLANTKQYEKALALLMTFPLSIKGSSAVLNESINIYKQYQNSICSQWIKDAYGAIAIKDYNSAINILSQIDSESKCNNEALDLMNQIKTSVENDIEKNDKLLAKEIDMKNNLEKERINAIKEIAVAYYSNQPVVTYNLIVK